MKLTETAKAAIRGAGLTLAEFARLQGYADGRWHGDVCGCTDTGRCANGFHHTGVNDCGCLPTLLDQAVRWRQATRWPNSVELAAPHSLYNWVSVSTPGALVTVSATAGGFRPDAHAESVVRIEAREGWTATVSEDEHGRMVVRLTAIARPGEAEEPR